MSVARSSVYSGPPFSGLRVYRKGIVSETNGVGGWVVGSGVGANVSPLLDLLPLTAAKAPGSAKIRANDERKNMAAFFSDF